MNPTDSIIPPDQVRLGALRDDAFDALVAEWGLDEARIAYAGLVRRLGQQIAERKDKEWRKRALHLQSCGIARGRVLAERIKIRNRAESGTREAVERKWSSFAERLAVALYLIQPSALADIVGPGDGSIDAEEWLHERRAAAARKAARQ